MQCRALQHERRHDGDFGGGQLLRVGVLLANGILVPTPRTIELGDEWRVVFDADLVHAVLVAVEREQSPVAVKACAFQRSEEKVGRERSVRRHVFGHARILQRDPREGCAKASAVCQIRESEST